MTTPMLELRDVSRHYRGAGMPAAERVSLTVGRGEICAVLGPSGAGKTTVLRLIAGFEQPDHGTVTLNGEVVSSTQFSLPPEDRHVGVVFQHGALFPHLTVRENVEFGLRRRAPRDRAERWRVVAELCGLGAFAERYPHEMSGGEQQRVALARALAPEFPLVLLDEPLSNVDPLRREALGADVRRILTATGTTAVLVTHDQHEAFSLADRIAFMRNGAIEQAGTAEEVYRTPVTAFMASFVGHATFLPGECRGGQVMTEIGAFTDLRSHPDGTAVRVPIRPGDCSLEDADQGESIIETATFAGDHWICTVRLPSGQPLRCDIDTAPRAFLCDGTRVRVVPRIRAAVTFAG
ncbi:MAG: ABC transporter ATP-binding protein [Gemmatimonadaceae bacterium]